MSNQRYMQRGVSASKEDVHNAIKNIDKGIFPQAFCKIIPDILGGDPEYCNIMHADGAGTKSSLAYLYWKETGDISVWKGIAQDAPAAAMLCNKGRSLSRDEPPFLPTTLGTGQPALMSKKSGCMASTIMRAACAACSGWEPNI